MILSVGDAAERSTDDDHFELSKRTMHEVVPRWHTFCDLGGPDARYLSFDCFVTHVLSYQWGRDGPIWKQLFPWDQDGYCEFLRRDMGTFYADGGELAEHAAVLAWAEYHAEISRCIPSSSTFEGQAVGRGVQGHFGSAPEVEGPTFQSLNAAYMCDHRSGE